MKERVCMEINKSNNIDFLECIILIGIRYEGLHESYEDKEKFCEMLLSSKLDNSFSIASYAELFLETISCKNSVFFKQKKASEQLNYIFQYLLPYLLGLYRYDLLRKIIHLEKDYLQKEIFLNQNTLGVQRIIRYELSKDVSRSSCDIEFVDITTSISLVADYLDYVDDRGQYKKIFFDEIQRGNICIWDVYGNDIPKNVLQKLEIDDIFSFLTLRDQLFLNAPCKENLLDAYSIVHEFIHFLSVKEKKYYTDSGVSESFFKEVCSVFHEKYFREFLLKKRYFNKDIDVILSFRNEANKTQGPVLLSLLTLICKRDWNIDVLLHLPLEPKQNGIVLDANGVCDFLLDVFMTSYGNYLDSYSYFVASYIGDILVSKIRDGKTYLLKRIQNVVSMLGVSSMDPMYFFDYLECRDAFYDFVSAISLVYPRRLEEKSGLFLKKL